MYVCIYIYNFFYSPIKIETKEKMEEKVTIRLTKSFSNH